MADRAFGRPETDRLPRHELGVGLCADMDSVCRRHHRIFRGRYVLFNPQTQEVMKNKFDTCKFDLHTTSPDIPNPCINALYGSLRRNCAARIKHILSTKYGLKFNSSRTPLADIEKSPLLFMVDFPIMKVSSARAYWAQSIRLDFRHGFIIRTHHRGLVFDIPAVELSTDTLYRVQQSLTCDHHPF